MTPELFTIVAHISAYSPTIRALLHETYQQIYAGNPDWQRFGLYSDIKRSIITKTRTYPASILHPEMDRRAAGAYSNTMPGRECFSYCLKCTRPPRLFARGTPTDHRGHVPPRQLLHREFLVDITRWCEVCVWKLHNHVTASLCAFRLLPHMIPRQAHHLIFQFLAAEGAQVRCHFHQDGTTLIWSPTIRKIYRRARRRVWHSILLTGYRHASLCLDLARHGHRGLCARNQTPPRDDVLTLLVFLLRNPFWKLLFSPCDGFEEQGVPLFGFPMVVLLAFLGDPEREAFSKAMHAFFTKPERNNAPGGQ